MTTYALLISDKYHFGGGHAKTQRRAPVSVGPDVCNELTSQPLDIWCLVKTLPKSLHQGHENAVSLCGCPENTKQDRNAVQCSDRAK